MTDQTSIKLYGAAWCQDSERVKNFLSENKIDYEYINVEIDKEASSLLEGMNNGKRITPTLVVNGTSFANPSIDLVSSLLGLNEGRPRVQMFGAEWCPDCHRAKAYLKDNGINFQFINIDEHAWSISVLEEINKGKRIIPTVIIDGQAYANPDNRKLRELLDIEEEAQTHLFDIAIIGGGASGLTTAIYAQRDRFSTVILEKRMIGGNASLTEKIENYPGFMNISGPELMDKMAEQAKTYGAEIKLGADVRKINQEHEVFHIETSSGEIKARSVVVATGSTYKKLNIPGENELIGAGVHFCATCDGAFYRDRTVIVVGGGNSALEEGIFLSRFTKKILLVHRGEEFSASSSYTDKLPGMSNIEIFLNQSPVEFMSTDDGKFKGLKVKDNATDEEQILEADGAFIFVGLVPNTKFLKGTVELTEQGFVKTMPGSVETTTPGIFAAGDCREGAIAQVAAATGEGVIASFAVKAYLKLEEV